MLPSLPRIQVKIQKKLTMGIDHEFHPRFNPFAFASIIALFCYAIPSAEPFPTAPTTRIQSNNKAYSDTSNPELTDIHKFILIGIGIVIFFVVFCLCLNTKCSCYYKKVYKTKDVSAETSETFVWQPSMATKQMHKEVSISFLKSRISL